MNTHEGIKAGGREKKMKIRHKILSMRKFPCLRDQNEMTGYDDIIIKQAFLRSHAWFVFKTQC
jgi:hypothetical protein